MTLLDAQALAPGAVHVRSPAPAPARIPAGPRPGDGRPRAEAKFLAVDGQRLWLRGVTYGTFEPGADGIRFPTPAQVAGDFAAMAAHGINAVRLYTSPPRWLLDEAAEAGLWVMVGLPWEQHVTFLSDRRRRASIIDRIGAGVASCSGHPAVLCYAVGNEVPAAIVRWHGRRHIERFLDRLCDASRAADPDALVTYVNFPSTEYLNVRSVDLLSFNVYLEDHERLAAYIARLHNLAGERPLLLAELGLDSLRAGVARQAEVLSEQVRMAITGGCAGSFVFAWTDDWHRGEDQVLDWAFGLTDRERGHKPALRSVADAFRDAPSPVPVDAPSVSVVICTHNGAATLHECLEGVLALDYAPFEVIVVDDGSTDGSAAVAHELGVNVISTPNRGLSAARNTGLQAASGEIVAYLDDDASPERAWLAYLALAFRETDHAAIGGPNVPPADESGVAACVANAPGGPAHVLVSDTEAEHLPGCNMAFRRDALLELGGFDPQFRVAGDDVDICWRLREAGMTLGFHPAAVVWHRRRATVRRFWRQQFGYGRAEALLERKWPEKYNAPGHATWGGRLYGRGTGALVRRSHVYYGTWGTAAFQREIERPVSRLLELAATPEWYLLLGGLLALGLLGALWAPLLVALVPSGLACAVALANAVRGARAATFAGRHGSGSRRVALRTVTFALHLLQPAARLAGRLGYGLVPWRRPQGRRFAMPLPRQRELWSETWKAPEQQLRRIEDGLREHGARVRAGGPCDRWDLQAWGGAFGAARMRTVVEEHGRGRQLLRGRIWPWIPPALPPAVAALGLAGTAAALHHAWLPAGSLLGLAALLLTASVCECGIAIASALSAMSAAGDEAGVAPLTLVVGTEQR